MGSHIPFLFMNYLNEFKELLLDELEIIKSIIENLIITVQNDKYTNVKYQDKNKILKCPNCKINSFLYQLIHYHRVFI